MRKDDNEEQRWFSSERFVSSGGKWFFITREETQEGPYETIEEAERELMLYIRGVTQDDIFGDK